MTVDEDALTLIVRPRDRSTMSIVGSTTCQDRHEGRGEKEGVVSRCRLWRSGME